MSIKFSYSVTLKTVSQSYTLIGSFTSYIGHLKNFDSLSYLKLLNVAV